MMEPIEITPEGRLKRIRITVYDIIPYLEDGWTPEGIAPVLSISVAEVHALMKFMEEHKEAVMAMHRKIEERIARGNPPEVEARLQGSRERLLAKVEELRRKKAEESANGPSHIGRH